MGSFLIFFGLDFLAGGLWARSFSHELKNITSRAMVMMRIAVLNTMDVPGEFNRLSQNSRQQ